MEINNDGLYTLVDGDYKPYQIPTTGRVIVCGVPGAFTPGCTHRHLPGFAKAISDCVLNDKVVFISVNDASVMHEWNKIYGHSDIDAVADPLAVFTKSIGKEVDFGNTMGMRSKRYAMLVEDGVFVKFYDDPFIEGVVG